MSSFEVPSTGTTDASAAGVLSATKGAVIVLVIGMAGMSLCHSSSSNCLSQQS